MKVAIQTLIGHGRTYDFDVKNSITVRQLKQLFSKETRNQFDLEQMSLIHIQTRDVLDKDNETLEYYDVEDGSILQLQDLTIVSRNIGSLGLRFVELGDGTGIERVKWATEAPRWRIAGRGLCLEGICENPECKAFEKQVVMTIGYKEFDVGKKKGEQASGQAPERCSCDWQRTDDEYHYFNQQKNGLVRWLTLKIEAKKNK
ncbi:unnamed protein product [Rotaria sp. Silwood1]|nr:unnamed protein product [Rotaria sp. Silwood1]CAF3939560.1 unnamed protein product [Rotaria sp. Silwood1]CAF4724511.1 unnamed protein product [Rotaria sp. Silwood1]CAF4747868.1 unnamed protein product [Rotaria sp. Silwood1]CAF5004305.1 unnamed protein product [Rotaria sp. Silwood1]